MKQMGMGLLEMMISLLLSTLVITALVQYYLNCKRHYQQLQIALDQTLEMQLVHDLMQTSVQMAGFTPCVSIPYLTMHEAKFAIKATANSLQIGRMSEDFATVRQFINATTVLTTPIRTLKRPVLIADCYHAEIQEISQVYQSKSATEITFKKPLHFTYIAPVYLGEWLEERFFIHPPAKGLYYQMHHTEQLTPIVHSLSVQLKNSCVGVELGLDGAKTIAFDMTIRAP